jgi:hypothetical protein
MKVGRAVCAWQCCTWLTRRRAGGNTLVVPVDEAACLPVFLVEYELTI